MKRITWLAGPPGAGKSSWAKSQTQWSRVLELSDVLAPLVEAEGLWKGVLTAYGQLVELLRAFERRPEYADVAPILVVGILPESLFPLAADEQVLLLLPERDRWKKQLRSRPLKTRGRRHYNDFAFAESCYDRLSAWDGRPGVERIVTDFDAELVGRAPPTLFPSNAAPNQRRPVLGVVGSAGALEPDLREAAFNLGLGAVEAGFRVVTGGLDGVADAVSQGARASKSATSGDTIGFIPSRDRTTANEACDIVVPTGLDIARNLLVVAAADVVVVVAGGAGTLSEVALAWQLGRPIVALARTGGWAEKLAGHRLDDRRTDPVLSASSVTEAVQLALRLASAPSETAPVGALSGRARERLRQAGWHRGRQVSIVADLAILETTGLHAGDRAWSALREFSGLTIPCDDPLITGQFRDLQIAVPPNLSKACMEHVASLVGEHLTPVGYGAAAGGVLWVADSGGTYIECGTRLLQAGESFRIGLVRLIEGARLSFLRS